MAEQIVSPGVFTRENDQSFITAQPVEVGAAIIGPTVKGPVEIPTVVTSYSEFKNKFGTTFTYNGDVHSYLTSLSAYNYFQNGGSTLLVTRVTAESFEPAISTTVPNVSGSGNPASGSINYLPDELNGVRLNYDGVNYTFISASELVQDYPNLNLYYYNTGTGADLASEINAKVPQYFTASHDGTTLSLTASFAGEAGNTITVSTGSYWHLINENSVALTLSGGTGISGNTFMLKTFSEGVIMNNSGSEDANGALISGSEDNLRWEISQRDEEKGTFTLLIRRGNDTTNEKVILETFTNLSLDPKSDNYISKRIGDSYQQVQTDDDENRYIETVGENPSRSRYVYVSDVLAKTPDYFDNNGVAKTTYKGYIPTLGSGSFYNGMGALIPAGVTPLFNKNIDINTQGLTGSNYDVAIDLLTNKDEYQYNVITAPGLIHEVSGVGGHTSQLNTLVTNTQNRGDALAVVDLVKYGSTILGTVGQANAINSSYAATYWPWVQIINPDTGKTDWVPASVLIPGVYAANDAAAEPWFAPAGINRGGLTQVVRPERRLQRADRDTLYEANVNPIANFPATGPVVFGQKTLQKKASALDRVNVRRLLIELKGYISQVANNLVFEQNTAATRNSFLAQVNPYMESVQQRQGVYAFKVVMDDSNNTPDVIDRNQLVGQIFIQPTRTAEFIILDFNVLPTGAEFPA